MTSYRKLVIEAKKIWQEARKTVYADRYLTPTDRKEELAELHKCMQKILDEDRVSSMKNREFYKLCSRISQEAKRINFYISDWDFLDAADAYRDISVTEIDKTVSEEMEYLGY